MEFLSKLLAKFLGYDFSSILIVVVAFNSLLSIVQHLLDALKGWLETFKDQTSSDVDNKVYSFLGVLSGYLAKLIALVLKLSDIIGANKPH